ncbi:hypothetical protein MEA186_13392 [Mesorhizobium amorphae CCNWGS0123]|uniref:Uncharacterized protein n=1 Tax=Mesorhizobium amorphae CCNWGS0123 TaxID=1082933 RepID=G6Y9Q6_9HYPH|nr:hypothetical protein MEA186_13392 [Mesorhizobium amorphae CCNWGS0123]
MSKITLRAAVCRRRGFFLGNAFIFPGAAPANLRARRIIHNRR